ncbi:capsular exopolysaccharide family [Paenibacillus sp. UNC496MF]|uniref:CpsD/CapB family tyrosine-protein kinase n=1 Tax=Paenibacillus sp. UNC496MF TaxID=1502753 RepID=UPI0008EAFB47|nr:CpsD/CapB family tyrosine-protein kinase [Paenibacillus sp. UNC496MF]SFI88097.1 capsular exopolysaccharide family [Paenibacillus sp. UNC496MF]
MRTSTNNAALASYLSPQSAIADTYRSLMTNISHISKETEMRCILVASVHGKEGATTTASNLAVAYAQAGRKVLLVDMSWRSPNLHQVYSLQNHKGTTDIWYRNLNWRDMVKDTDIAKLFVMTSGSKPDKTSNLFSARHVERFLAEAREEYEVIIIDSSPVLESADSKILAALSDGVLLVVKEGKTKKPEAAKALKELDYVHARVIGTVIKQRK